MKNGFFRVSVCFVPILLAGCKTFTVESAQSLNKPIKYIDWDTGPRDIQLKPGMDLHIIQTTQRQMMNNDRAPVVAEQSWRIPRKGEVSRSDWLRFHALLVGSRPMTAEKFDLDDVFANAPDDTGTDFENQLDTNVLRPALDSMIVRYSRKGAVSGNPMSAGLVRNYMCRGHAEEFVRIARPAESGIVDRDGSGSKIVFELPLKSLNGQKREFEFLFGDDWFYRTDLRTLSTAPPPPPPPPPRPDPSEAKPNPWYDPTKNVISVRTLVEVRIAIRTASDAGDEPAAPCLSVTDFETRTGAEVIAIRREKEFVDLDDDPLGSRPTGSDDRVAIAFRSIRSLKGASGYFKADPAFKNDMLLAHGDILILKRPPKISGYRLD